MLVLKLALKELFFDKLMSLCQIAAIASILAPLLLLFSLLNGILAELEHKLLNDPQVLSLSLDTSYRFSSSDLELLARQKEVAFMVPEINSLHALVDIKFPGKVQRASALPTAAGDPVVRQSGLDASYLLKDNELYLNADLARVYNLKVGDSVMLALGRVLGGQRESVRRAFVIKGILKQALVNDDTLLLNTTVLAALDDYRNGYDPLIFGNGTRIKNNERFYAKFRLYAKSLEDVIPLYYKLVDQKLNVSSKVREIENLQALDRVMNFVFIVIALVTTLGGMLALMGLLLSALKARRRNFVLLRLMGLSKAKTYGLVLVQTLVICCLAFGLALALFVSGSQIFNTYFEDLIEGLTISKLLLWHYVTFFSVSLGLSCVISLLAARNVFLKVQIADVLREA